jgi:hypothetical protein
MMSGGHSAIGKATGIHGEVEDERDGQEDQSGGG